MRSFSVKKIPANARLFRISGRGRMAEKVQRFFSKIVQTIPGA